MIIRAARPESQYLIVRNEVVRDERLSHRARGILLDILSRPDNWETSAERLMVEGSTVKDRDGAEVVIGKEGRDAVLTAFRELRLFGYMRTVRYHDGRGRWTSATYVYDSPLDPTAPDPEAPDVLPLDASPGLAEPTSGPTRGNVGPSASPLVAPKTAQPGLAEPTSIEGPLEEDQLQRLAHGSATGDLFNPSASLAAPVPPSGPPPKGPHLTDGPFSRFWALYPRKKNASRYDAYRAWCKHVVSRDGAGADVVIASVHAYASAMAAAGKDPDYLPHPSTWLGQRRWETLDEHDGAAPVAAGDRRWGDN